MKISVVSEKWKSSKSLGSKPVRVALLAKGPDSSIGGVPVGNGLDEIHMEEERVRIKVQAEEEEEIRATHEREQGEEKRENKQSLKRMTHGWDDAHQHLSQMWYHTSFSTRCV